MSKSGYIEMVRLLLVADPDVCLVCDGDGRTPLHLAVMNGQLDVIKELVQGRLNQGQTVLHSCVIYNRLEAMKLLMESNWVGDMANPKDNMGNTILHMATILKRVQGADNSTREKRLYDASLCGSVESLNRLIQEDELTIDRSSVTSFHETPLHVAAVRGHLDFARALLSYKRDLVRKLDSHGRMPLHLASGNGYVEMVRLLLVADPDVCLVRDEDGRTPLHLAVMNGQVDVIKELVQERPEVTQFTLNQGETILHSCVIYSHLEALKLLMESSCVGDMANLKDDIGNTILHTATILKQVQTIKYLLGRNEVKVHATNRNGLTALDIILHMPKDLKTMEIQELLVSSEALRAIRNTSDLPNATDSHQSNHQQPPATNGQPPRRGGSNCNRVKKYLKKKSIRIVNKNFMKREHKPWLEKKADNLIVAASVIAAMAYQAAISPPGGVYDQKQTINRDGVPLTFEAGTSILSSTDPKNYKNFWICNTTAFVASISIIFLFVCGIPLRRRIMSWTLTAAMWVTVTAAAFTYDIAIEAVTPGDAGFERQHFAVAIIVKIALFTWLLAAACGIVFLVSRLILQSLRDKRRKSARKRVSRNATHHLPDSQISIV